MFIKRKLNTSAKYNKYWHIKNDLFKYIFKNEVVKCFDIYLRVLTRIFNKVINKYLNRIINFLCFLTHEQYKLIA